MVATEGAIRGMREKACVEQRQTNMKKLSSFSAKEFVHIVRSTPNAEASVISPTLTQEAYERLEEMIITLELAPGESVSEAILSKRLGIGTTPIREALHRLARQYLVKIIPRRGVVVTSIDVRLQFEVLEARRELDRLISRGAAQRASPGERQVLTQLIKTTQAAIQANDIKEFLRTDAELNEWLTKAARNSVASDISATLHAVSRRFWYFHLSDDDQFKRTAVLHLAVVKAIASGNTAAAAAASDQLIDYLVEFANATLPGA
jgi:DNA-binding GntR family transcriptional regulator